MGEFQYNTTLPKPPIYGVRMSLIFTQNKKGATSPLVNLVGLCLIVLILYAAFLMNLKWTRTAVAVQRVGAIHQTILQWQALALEEEGGDSDASFPVPESPEDLASLNPEATALLNDGDDDYKYGFSGLRYENGVIYPLVSATAREPSQVYGEVIISEQGGTGSIGRVSEAGKQFSLIGFSKEYPYLVGAFVALLIGLIFIRSFNWTKGEKA